jgi:Ca2+-binding RTX toxin-like protein
MEIIMRTKKYTSRAALSLAGLAAGVALVAGTTVAAGPADHTGEPADWGPQLEAYCDDPTTAAADGYNVIDDPHPDADGHYGDLLEGTNGPDLILANGGNDIVEAGLGNDIICGSFGNDTINGEGGNDAVFGGGHENVLRGGNNDDYLDGGGQIDWCDGGNGDDATGPGCNTVND